MKEQKSASGVDKEMRDSFFARIRALSFEDVHGGRHRDIYRAVEKLLSDLTRQIGCHSYLFVLTETEIATRHGEAMIEILREILDRFVFHPETSRDVAFAAYYAIGVHYARHHAADRLRRLIYDQEYNAHFKYEYPLIYELLTRYNIIVGNYYTQFRIARFAKKQYETFLSDCPAGTEYNVCFKVGYLDGACACAEDVYIHNDLSIFAEIEEGVRTDDDCEGMTPDSVFTETSVEKISYPIQRGDMDIAERFAEEAIAYNPDYPKYHYYKARVIFFKHLFAQKKITRRVKRQIEAELERGRELEAKRNSDDLDRRLEMYQRFEELVEDHYRGVSASRRRGKIRNGILRCTKQPEHESELRPRISCDADINADDEYVFISYCSRDFKPVYIDLFEMSESGVRFWYDKEIDTGKHWLNGTVEKRIKNAACVIIYLSEAAMLSEAVRKEIETALRYHKELITISLTGEGRISTAVRNMLAGNEEAKKLGSEEMKFLFSAFADTTDTPCRGRDILSTGHLARVIRRLKNDFPATIMDYQAEVMTQENNAEEHHHPYEDAYYNGRDVWVVADGITRNNKAEYTARPGFSISRVVAEIFADSIGRGMEAGLGECASLGDVKDLMREEFRIANGRVHKLLHDPEAQDDPFVRAMCVKYEHDLSYTLAENMDEPPGCVTVVAVRYRDHIVFGSAGDCMGFLARDEQVLVFSQKQTSYAYDVIDCERDRRGLMRDFVNQHRNEYNYGVVNGDENACHCFRISHVDLRQGDVVYLATDGISDYVQYARAMELNEKSMKIIFRESDALDRQLGIFSDDKTLIRIRYS